MDCKTARAVWNHPQGFLTGVREHLPGALERLEEYVSQFVTKAEDVFDTSVKSQIGCGEVTSFSVFHADDEDPITRYLHDLIGDTVAKGKICAYLSDKFGQNIQVGNICCSGCLVADPPTFHDEVLIEAIQKTAVNTQPDGTTF